MALITAQGDIATGGGGTTLVTASTKTLAINSIVINNIINNYVISLYKVSPDLGLNTLIYQYTLNAGDSVRDLECYVLNPDEYLQITSDVAGSTFVLNGLEMS